VLVSRNWDVNRNTNGSTIAFVLSARQSHRQYPGKNSIKFNCPGLGWFQNSSLRSTKIRSYIPALHRCIPSETACHRTHCASQYLPLSSITASEKVKCFGQTKREESDSPPADAKAGIHLHPALCGKSALPGLANGAAARTPLLHGFNPHYHSA